MSNFKKINVFEEVEEFMENNEGYSYYIACQPRRDFIRYDNEYMPPMDNFYLIKSDENRIYITDLKEKNLSIVSVDLSGEK